MCGWIKAISSALSYLICSRNGDVRGVQPQQAGFLQGSWVTHINNVSTFLHIQLFILVLYDPGHSQLINNQFRITFLLESFIGMNDIIYS